MSIYNIQWWLYQLDQFPTRERSWKPSLDGGWLSGIPNKLQLK